MPNVIHGIWGDGNGQWVARFDQFVGGKRIRQHVFLRSPNRREARKKLQGEYGVLHNLKLSKVKTIYDPNQ